MTTTGRLTAQRDWAALPTSVRREVVERAKRGSRHPDAAVAGVALRDRTLISDDPDTPSHRLIDRRILRRLRRDDLIALPTAWLRDPVEDVLRAALTAERTSPSARRDVSGVAG